MGAMVRWETSQAREIMSLRQSVVMEKNRFKYALNVCHREIIEIAHKRAY